MDGFVECQSYLTVPLIIDSSDNEMVNCSTWQFEEPKFQTAPVVIFENGNVAVQTECPVLLSNNISPHNILLNDAKNIPVLNISGSPADVQLISSPSLESHVQGNGVSSSTLEEVENESLIQDDISNLMEKEVVYKCKLCDLKSFNKDELASHIKTHLEDQSQTRNEEGGEEGKKKEIIKKTAFICSKCSVAFASFSDWRVHLSQVHKTALSVQSILENTVLNEGNSTVNKNNKKPKTETNKPTQEKKNSQNRFSCVHRSCLVRLSRRELVEKHRECHSGPRSFACPRCSAPFRKWVQCANHLWTVHSVDIDLYSCNECTFKSALKAKLREHMEIHKQEKEYICDECGKAFKQFKQLRNHRVFHLKAVGSTNIPKWSKRPECQQCKRTFYDQKSLKKHIQSTHSDLRSYVCQVCGHKSASNYRMVLHIRQHTGEKPFSCPVCQFATGDQNCLRRHVWKHSEVRPYSCPHCSFACIQSNALKKHLLAIHPGLPGILSCTSCQFTSLSQQSLDSHVARVHSVVKEEEKLETASGDTSLGKGNSSFSNEMLDEESQNCFEVPVVDTGGITIPAE